MEDMDLTIQTRIRILEGKTLDEILPKHSFSIQNLNQEMF
jgi:hypothetical protein